MKQVRKKKHNKKTVLICTFVFILLAVWLGFKITENGTFTVMDNSNKEVATYHHFYFAKRKLKEQGPHAYVINANQQIVALNRGIVNLNTKDVTQNTIYTLDNSDETGYVNGQYGADALYLDTNADATKVKLEISGIKGWFDINDVKLQVWNNAIYVSSYYVKKGSLYHAIITNTNTDNVNIYRIGRAPKGLQEKKYYYSYDGHYFYTSIKKLSKDANEDAHDHAVNTTAYYNFYQYVPHRTSTNLKQKDFDQYLYDIKGIKKKAKKYPCKDNESVLYHLGNTFLSAQKKYHINAAMMFGLACNESAYGQSQYAIENKNLFGHRVYDASPDSANSYSSLQSCINQHAYNFLQLEYANPHSDLYHGSWFGSKDSGINVNYASDPYWGEKAASIYYQLEPQAYKKYKLITVDPEHSIDIYNKENGDILYTYERHEIASFIVLNEDDHWYKIQSEVPIKNDKISVKSNYKCSVVYIQKDDLKS